MRHGRMMLLAFGLGFVATTAQADDTAPKAVLDKALKAHGGEANLAKLPASATTFKGKFHGMGEGLDMTGTVSAHGDDRLKIDIEVAAGGQKIRFVSVLNGAKGWVRLGDTTTELDKDQLDETRHAANAAWVATLAPLKGKPFTLDGVGESKIDGKPAVGLRVSREGRRDVNLYFDKATGLLLKTETRVKDEGSGQEVTEETYLSDYKDVQGTKQAMKFTVKRDGKLYLEGEVTDFTLVEKHDADVYAKP